MKPEAGAAVARRSPLDSEKASQEAPEGSQAIQEAAYCKKPFLNPYLGFFAHSVHLLPLCDVIITSCTAYNVERELSGMTFFTDKK